MRINLTIFLLIFFSTALFGQRVRRPGYIVNNEGDTLRGWFDYRAWEKNPKQFIFGTDSLGKNKHVYNIGDVRYFEVTGHDAYLRAFVEKDDRPVTHAEAWPRDMELFSMDTVFLRILALGEWLNLYQLVDSKPRYYISTDGAHFRELVYKLYRNDNGSSSYNRSYQFRQQLLPYLHRAAGEDDRKKLYNRIAKASYGEYDLAAIVRYINGDTGKQVFEESAFALGQRKWTLAIGAGVAQLAFSGNQPQMEALRTDQGFISALSLGYNMHMPRSLASVTLRAELSVSMARYHKEGDDPYTENARLRYRLHQYNLSPSFSMLWHFVRNDRYRIFLGVGGTLFFSTYSKNEIGISVNGQPWHTLDDYLTVIRLWPAGMLRTGFILRDRLEIGLLGQAFGSVVEQQDFLFLPRLYQLQMAYHF